MFGVGILLGLCVGAISGSRAVVTKAAVARFPSVTVTWISRIGGALILLPVAVFIGEFRIFSEIEVWTAVIGGGVIYAFSNYFITKALNESDVSIVSPLLSLFPVATIIPSIILVGEKPTLAAGVGILLMTAGAYVLNFQESEKGWLQPFYALSDDSGARLVFLAILIAGVVPSLNKVALQHVSPILLVSFQLPVSALVLFSIGHTTIRETSVNSQKSVIILCGVGLLTATLFLAQLTGYQHTQVSYIQSLKRFNLLIVIPAAHYVFGEENIQTRFIGGGIMAIGAILIILLG